MKRHLLIMAALIMVFASCQKPSSNNGPFSCTCNYAFQRGFYWVADTAVTTNYAKNTSFTDAQLYCNTQRANFIADTSKHYVACYIH